MGLRAMVFSLAFGALAAGMLASTVTAQEDAGARARHEVPEAGVSVELRPDWAVLEEPGIVYQRFGASNGAFSIRWGPTATVEWVRDHLGLGGGSVRTIERDRATRVGGMRARRLEVRLDPGGATCEGACRGAIEHASMDPTIFVLVFILVGHTPVVVSYRCPESELDTFRPELEAMLRSVERL